MSSNPHESKRSNHISLERYVQIFFWNIQFGSKDVVPMHENANLSYRKLINVAVNTNKLK